MSREKRHTGIEQPSKHKDIVFLNKKIILKEKDDVPHSIDNSMALKTKRSVIRSTVSNGEKTRHEGSRSMKIISPDSVAAQKSLTVFSCPTTKIAKYSNLLTTEGKCNGHGYPISFISGPNSLHMHSLQLPLAEQLANMETERQQQQTRKAVVHPGIDSHCQVYDRVSYADYNAGMELAVPCGAERKYSEKKRYVNSETQNTSQDITVHMHPKTTMTLRKSIQLTTLHNQKKRVNVVARRRKLLSPVVIRNGTFQDHDTAHTKKNAGPPNFCTSLPCQLTTLATILILSNLSWGWDPQNSSSTTTVVFFLKHALLRLRVHSLLCRAKESEASMDSNVTVKDTRQKKATSSKKPTSEIDRQTSESTTSHNQAHSVSETLKSTVHASHNMIDVTLNVWKSKFEKANAVWRQQERILVQKLDESSAAQKDYSVKLMQLHFHHRTLEQELKQNVSHLAHIKRQLLVEKCKTVDRNEDIALRKMTLSTMRKTNTLLSGDHMESHTILMTLKALMEWIRTHLTMHYQFELESHNKLQSNVQKLHAVCLATKMQIGKCVGHALQDQHQEEEPHVSDKDLETEEHFYDKELNLPDLTTSKSSTACSDTYESLSTFPSLGSTLNKKLCRSKLVTLDCIYPEHFIWNSNVLQENVSIERSRGNDIPDEYGSRAVASLPVSPVILSQYVKEEKHRALGYSVETNCMGLHSAHDVEAWLTQRVACRESHCSSLSLSDSNKVSVESESSRGSIPKATPYGTTSALFFNQKKPSACHMWEDSPTISLEGSEASVKSYGIQFRTLAETNENKHDIPIIQKETFPVNSCGMECREHDLLGIQSLKDVHTEEHHSNSSFETQQNTNILKISSPKNVDRCESLISFARALTTEATGVQCHSEYLEAQLKRFSSQCQIAFAELQQQTSRLDDIRAQLQQLKHKEANWSAYDQLQVERLSQSLDSCRWILDTTYESRERAAENRFRVLVEMDNLKKNFNHRQEPL